MSDFKPDIWRLQAQLNTSGLVDALANDDPSIRKRAAAALRALGATNTIPDLKAALDREADPDTRSHILAAIEELQQEMERQSSTSENEQIDPLTARPEIQAQVERLKSDNPETVIEAARALGDMGDKLAVEPLVLLFKNPRVSIKVRLAAAEALLKLESAPVEAALLGALRSPDWHLRRNGAAILGQLRADWAIEPLGKALRDPNEVVRRTAYAALKHIGTPEALKVIAIIKARATASQPKVEAPAAQPPAEQPPATTPAPASPAAASPAPAAPAAPPDPPGDQAPQQPEAAASITPDDDDTASSPPTTPDGQKLSWPKRKEAPDPTLMVTRPLRPEALDEARAHFEKLKQDDTDKKEE